ncbi:MAG: C40 family peptidase [Cetobacterium sp.]|uniref:C40 family peptidase n=1 Tax=Bacteria TaxID=2 RepID=UPI002FC61572
MGNEKKLIKKLVKGLVLSNAGFMLLLVIFTSAIGIALVGEKKLNDSSITDLVGLGVPEEFIPYFNEATSIFNIPNWCLAAVAKQESNFNPDASYGGAYGMMQIQKVDPWSGKDLWAYLISLGLGEEYKKIGYDFSTADEMWDIYLKDARAQIIAGGYEIRYYANYVLYMKDIIDSLDYNNNENMKLIEWNASENDDSFREILRRVFACYNGGPGYGMSVDLDKAQNDYPNKVFKYAMEFRNGGLVGDNETIEKIIEAGMKWVGKSPYVWGGGRTQADVDAGRFDCSSFIHYCYANVGIQLGDRASVVTFSLINMGTKIDPSDMKRGDIIFFDTYTINGHVGIYLGDGKFINDNSSLGVWIDDLNNPYWKNTFNGEVRRIIKIE